MWKIASLQLTEAELFFGVLQVVTVFLLAILTGTPSNGRRRASSSRALVRL
jgi:hypothetical protein